jgi:hypothetical protein
MRRNEKLPQGVVFLGHMAYRFALTDGEIKAPQLQAANAAISRAPQSDVKFIHMKAGARFFLPATELI